MSNSRFVCVINRNRDGYQVPLALREADLLESFVTDFYAPDRPPKWLPRVLQRRRLDGLPASACESSRWSFLVQNTMHALRAPMGRVFPYTDRVLARHALRSARRSGSHLYCYASYMPRAGEIPAGRKVIDFEFHPHPALTLDLLREDAGRYSEVARTFEAEAYHAGREQVNDSWKQAHAIVCASRMTRRSLEHVGCDPALITVIPYGFLGDATAVAARPDGPCRVLYVGQGIQRKGLHHLLRAWRTIRRANAELTLICYRIDPGIAELADQPGVTLLGRQSREALARHYAAADVFAMPSLIEGFGLVYLEALAAGCHVIGTENTGLPDLPLSETALSLAGVGDIEGLAAALEALIARKAAGTLDPQAIADQARQWSWSDFRRAIAEHAKRVVCA